MTEDLGQVVQVSVLNVLPRHGCRRELKALLPEPYINGVDFWTKFMLTSSIEIFGFGSASVVPVVAQQRPHEPAVQVPV
jgi:hypothetical protein